MNNNQGQNHEDLATGDDGHAAVCEEQTQDVQLIGEYSIPDQD